MIIEDYVSFETAKLLKEKGFDWKLLSNAYLFKGNTYELAGKLIEADADIIIPTQATAMKWLREEHKIGVFPSTYGLTVGVNGSVKHVYGTAIINLETYELMINDIMPMPTYEEACEAAIKFCLEKLI